MSDIKELKQEEYPLEIVNDLGMQFANETSTTKRRWAEFRCACGETFGSYVYDVKNGKTGGCYNCKILNKRTTLKNIETGVKTCQTCKQEKQLSEFHNSKNSADKRSARCKVCDGIARKKYYETFQKHSIESKQKTRDRILINKYGITLEIYNQMLIEQDHKCLICEVPAKELSRILVVDHDHDTGEVRGLLCNKCNRGIGLLGDSTQNLKRAVEYLTK